MKYSDIFDSSFIMNLVAQLRISLVATLSLVILCCGVYPLLIWGLAQGFFPQKANGSLIVRDGKIYGSSLIAQAFSGPGYFHPRPSAAGDGYDASASGGSNLGPTSRQLIDAVHSRVQQYRAENELPADVPLPADAVTASASGLDPHISLENALIQVHRVARARGISDEDLRRKVATHTDGPDWGLFGEKRVNVLLLNLDLDRKG